MSAPGDETVPVWCECGHPSMCRLCAILVGWSLEPITVEQRSAIDVYLASSEDTDGPEYQAMIAAGLPPWGAAAVTTAKDAGRG